MSFNEEKIRTLREQTDGTQKVIHLNNAGASLPPNEVRNAVISYLEEEALIGGYELHSKRLSELNDTYSNIARLIGASDTEIALVENATVAWNSAFNAIDWQEGDEIICNRSDYASNYLAYLHQPEHPIIKVIPTKDNGDEDLEALGDMISSKTKLVSITHMPTNSGHLAPAEEIGKICKENGVLFLLDACQTIGQYPLDVKKLNCDMLSATGRKYLRGPRGTGFLYVNQNVLTKLIPVAIDLHSAQWTEEKAFEFRSDAKRFENWEGNRATQMGLNVAVQYARKVGLEEIWLRIQQLASVVRAKMKGLSHVHCHDQGSVLGGIVSFTVDGLSAEEVKHALLAKGFNVSWNDVSNTRLDMEAKGLKEIVGCSVHYYNTEEEIDLFIEALKKLCN